MYVRVILTLLLLAMVAVAIGVWRPQRAPVAQGPSAGELLLQTRIGDLDLRGVSREQAIKMLQEKVNATLVVYWPSLCYFSRSEADFRAFKLDAYLANPPLGTALRVVLGYGATWQVAGSVISAAGSEYMVPGEMTVHAYDVSDLVSDDYWGVKTATFDPATIQTARMERVREILVQHTPALGWHINYIGSGTPGGHASVSVCGAWLIVTNSTQAHAEIARILGELRQSSGPRGR